MLPFFKCIPLFINSHQRVLTLTLFPALAVLLFLRAPYALLRPQFWAEDALVFFDQAAHLGIASLAQPYVGYLHGIPRLVAWIASLLPSGIAPWIYGWSAYLMALAAILLIAHSTVGGRRAFGLIAALVITFTPHLSQEIFWTLTNVQWTVSAFLLVQLVADPPGTKAMTWLWVVFSFLAGTTSPLSATLLPIMLLRLWFVRDTRQAWPLGAAIFAGLLQASALFASSLGTRGTHLPSVTVYLEIIGRRIFVQGFLPARFWPTAGAHPVLIAVASLSLLISGIILAQRQRPACLLLLAASALMCFVTVARMAASIPKMLDPGSWGFGDRYFFPIRIAIILVLLFMAFDEVSLPRLGATAFICMIPFATMPSFSAPAQPDREWGRYAPLIDARMPVDIPINPFWVGVYHYRPPKK